MGLSASQAKLLSITSRLSSNELRSQEITQEKALLSNQTYEANERYLAALRDTNLTYLTYDLDGNQTYTALTGSQLTTYAPLKNQYGLINSSGKILVSETDAANFESSNNINEFLEKYGVTQIDTGKTVTVTNPAYQGEYDKWLKDHQDWVDNYPKIEDYTKEVPDVNNDIYNAVRNSGGCFGNGMNGLNCYMHVLSDLIGPGTHKTSDGHEITIVTTGGWNWNSALHGVENFEKITQMLKEGHCSGDVIEGTAVIDGVEYDNMAYEEIEYNGTTELKLVGGTVSDPNMSLWQRAVDLLWEVHNDYDGSATGGRAKEQNLAKFLYFVEHDLKQAVTKTEIDYDAYQKAVDEYREEPQMPDIPATIEEKVYEYSDRDKAQWYVNLWHRMNGENQERTDSTSGSNSPVSLGGRTPGRQYDILEDGLMNSAEWLQYSLEHGSIMLEKVEFTDPTKEGTGLEDSTWRPTIYTSALDISEETNEKTKAKAEAEYENAQKVIEAKGKNYDNILSLLDTEHDALQSEYDSVKSVIDKNVDRTLKMYSA